MPTIEALITGALVGLVPGLIMVVGLVGLVIFVSRSVLMDAGGPPQRRSDQEPTRPASPGAPSVSAAPADPSVRRRTRGPARLPRLTPERSEDLGSARLLAHEPPPPGVALPSHRPRVDLYRAHPRRPATVGLSAPAAAPAGAPPAPVATPGSPEPVVGQAMTGVSFETPGIVGPAEPVLRACRDCLAVVENPSGESCPACGGRLAQEHTIGGQGRVRNPMRSVENEMRGWVGDRLDDAHGARIGTIHDVVVDPETDVVWLVVNLARFGEWHTLVPALGAMVSNGRVLVRHTRAFVRAAPRGLSADTYRWGPFRSRLYRYYQPVGKPRERTPAVVQTAHTPSAQHSLPDA